MSELPPPLNRRLLQIRMQKALPHYPPPVIKAALEELVRVMATALKEGRPITLRGFGRLETRRYTNSPKTLGVVFRPGAELMKRVNAPGRADSI